MISNAEKKHDTESNCRWIWRKKSFVCATYLARTAFGNSIFDLNNNDLIGCVLIGGSSGSSSSGNNKLRLRYSRTRNGQSTMNP